MRESKKKYGYAELQAARAANSVDKIDWEMRPSGMLVQKRDEVAEQQTIAQGPLIRVRVSFGSVVHEITISPFATFGDLKKALVQPAGLETREQRILYRGKEKDNGDFLHLVGVKDKAKVVLVEDPECRERKLEESRHKERIARSTKAVSAVKAEVDKLAERVLILESDVHGRTRVPDTDFEDLTERLMMQLLKLDGIEAFGDAKTHRRVQVRRVQKFVEALDALKVRNANPSPAAGRHRSSSSGGSSTSAAAVIQATMSPGPSPRPSPSPAPGPVLTKSTSVVTTHWETFDNGENGSFLLPPRPVATAIETDWEKALFSLS